jgi:hypothetical protein
MNLVLSYIVHSVLVLLQETQITQDFDYTSVSQTVVRKWFQGKEKQFLSHTYHKFEM